MHAHPTPAGGALGALTRAVLRHRRLVAVAWAVLALAGLAAAGPASDALDDDFAMPGSAAYAANERIERALGSGGGSPALAAVVRLPAGAAPGDPAVRADLRALERRLAAALPGARVASYGSLPDDALVGDDGRTTFALAHLPAGAVGAQGAVDPAALAAARGAAAGSRVAGAPVVLTGTPVLQQAAEDEAGGTGVLVETLLAGVAALAVLAFVFASALALVPAVIAAVAIPTSLLAVWGLASLTDVSSIVLFLVSLIGLGIAIDYALLVVTRWREERDAGAGDDEAVAVAMATAGRAVVLSGATVAIGLLAAVALPVPFLRSMAIGGLLVPLVSVAVALTLLPVLLATIGPRADRRRLRRTDRAERHWAAWARLVLRRRWAATAGGLAVLGALAAVAGGMLLGLPEAGSLDSSGPPRAALQALERSGVGAAPLAPVEVLAPAGRAEEVARELGAVEGVRGAIAPQGDGWRAGGLAAIDVLPAVDTNSREGREVVAAVRQRAGELPGVAVGGSTALVEDFVDDVYGAFPLMLGLIAAVTFVLLARAFRSLLLPLKAVALNVLSVVAAWGAMTVVWQHGAGAEAVFGTRAPGSIEFWVPMMVFAFLYGLSMDYEVFILARMREEYDATGSTGEAVVRGIARTGRLVTSAALILFLAFASMATAGPVEVKVLATGLAAGILIDAVVVRALLVPAVVSVMGRWNWWLPRPLGRLLRVPAAASTAGR
ncbi:MMPL family transporter [Miltoncostaea marina]|uniref:MMPL family transporter n=1 Tax=Miltoncostaea marina TaxID=2843215 RepID=UPI001C3DA650|nr:MMPL family transporter [Miltoncostaea marina]